MHDNWGLLLRADTELAAKDTITAEDLWKQPLLISRQVLLDKTHGEALLQWLRKPFDELNIVGSYNLLFNASLMVETGIGCALAFADIINTANSNLCFRPLKPTVSAQPNIFWKRSQFFSQASYKFLELLKEEFPS